MVGNVPGSVIDEAMELDAGQLVRTLVPRGTASHHICPWSSYTQSDASHLH